MRKLRDNSLNQENELKVSRNKKIVSIFILDFQHHKMKFFFSSTMVFKYKILPDQSTISKNNARTTFLLYKFPKSRNSQIKHQRSLAESDKIQFYEASIISRKWRINSLF